MLNVTFSRKVKEYTCGYMFIAPMMLLILLFLAFPVVFSFILGFTEWNLISGFENIKFVGIKNFIAVWSDEWFIKSLANMFIFTLGVVPCTVIISFFIALFVNKNIFFAKTIRTLFFMPYLSNIVAVSMIWFVLFSANGPVNELLRGFGIDNPPIWLADFYWAMPSVILLQIWIGIGFNSMIYLAGLQNIPKELYESARIDGANSFVETTRITIPMLIPTTFFICITLMIGTLKVFAPINIMTHGGPGTSTTVLAYYIYLLAFNYYKMGYASAVSLIFFVIVLIITLIQWKVQKRWEQDN